MLSRRSNIRDGLDMKESVFGICIGCVYGVDCENGSTLLALGFVLQEQLYVMLPW